MAIAFNWSPQRPTEDDALLLDADELLVPDSRGSLTPAQMVERKLRTILGDQPSDIDPCLPHDGCTRDFWADAT